MSAGGRWAATAVRTNAGWTAGMAVPVAALDSFVDGLFASGEGSTLAGFDFPIGLPAHYGRRTGFAGFEAALAGFGAGPWSAFYDVAERFDEIAITRPFYPRRATTRGSAVQRHLLAGHGVATIDELMRRCERGGPGRRAAGCMFWTLGPNQVGRAALTGWRQVVAPARARGAALWPFDGSLASLGTRPGVTLAETYPADVYARLGAAFSAQESKTRQACRAAKAEPLFAWAKDARVALTDGLVSAIRDGFPNDPGGDQFDAVVGLFGMIGIVAGSWPEGAPVDDDIRRWEGWILGRTGS